jgi:hypothetical protein
MSILGSGTRSCIPDPGLAPSASLTLLEDSGLSPVLRIPRIMPIMR